MKRRRFALYTLVTGSVGGMIYNWRGDIAFDPTRSKPRGGPAKVVINYNKNTEKYNLNSKEIKKIREDGRAALPKVTKHVIEQRTDRSRLELTCGIKSLLFGPVVAISYNKAYNEDGELVGKPSIPFKKLKQQTPKNITLEIKKEKQRNKFQLPVSISKGKIMQQ